MSQSDILNSDPYSTQSYNRYSYVKNNPLKYTDPSGYVDVGHRSSSDENAIRTLFCETANNMSMGFCMRMQAMADGTFTDLYNASRAGSIPYCGPNYNFGGVAVILTPAEKAAEGGSKTDLRLFEKSMSLGSLVAGSTQCGMVQYRGLLTLSQKIGTFGRFSSNYGSVGRFGSGASYLAAGVSLYSDFSSYSNNEITGLNFFYRQGILGASMSLGRAVGGGRGLILGVAIGYTGQLAETVYKDFLVPTWRMTIYNLNNMENSLKNGQWYPGRY